MHRRTVLSGPWRVGSAAALSWLLLLSSAANGQESTQAQAAPAGQPENHSVSEGDTLWSISGKYLGSSYEWPRLWAYNPEITNPHWIYPGHVLRLREGAAGGYTEGGGGPGGSSAAQASGLLRKGGKPTAPGKIMIGDQVYLDEAALKESARIVGAPEDHMMFSPSDEVYLQYAKGETIETGKEVVVYRRLHRVELSPKPGKLRHFRAGDGGEIVQVVGALRVQSVDEDKRIARALVTEAIDPIERGFEVANVPRTMLQVPPKPSDKKMQAQILASTRPLGTLGQGQIVFINAGTKQGVQVGNRFLVVRQGDPWRQTLYLKEELSGEERPEKKPLADSNYPWEVVGEIRAMYVREDTTTGYISDSLVEINPGDRVELREGY